MEHPGGVGDEAGLLLALTVSCLFLKVPGLVPGLALAVPGLVLTEPGLVLTEPSLVLTVPCLVLV